MLVASPASACGCGAYVPSDGDARVFRERALIRYDGRTEEIVMGLSVEGESREAAWILPVPSRATVRLGDRRLFAELEELTRPLQRTKWRIGDEENQGAGSADTGAPVSVLERQELGPFDVATLAASDAGALADWLDRNGYALSDGLSSALRPYVDEGWYYVAARLRPEGAGALGGELDPLRVTFASERIVYPMRASSVASDSLGVLLYVLAPHRVEPPDGLEDLLPPATSPSRTVTYAQWVAPDALERFPALEPFVDRRLFLTRFSMYLVRPSEIEEDFVFRYAPGDETYREMEVEYRYVSPWLPILLVLPLATALVAVVAVRGNR
jgi:hypothetical protein